MPLAYVVEGRSLLQVLAVRGVTTDMFSSHVAVPLVSIALFKECDGHLRPEQLVNRQPFVGRQRFRP